ncbi:MAG TPA: xanthine dehydrogenase family protein subunit M [Chloroflexi bacterium]|nr:xanthine dehydrogenase family protein subunit M [Chloroflexota bacterium]
MGDRWQHYHLPTTVDEAIALLSRYEGAARPVAGGTDLIVGMERGEVPPLPALVDLSRIEEMRQIALGPDGYVYLGAAVTHSTIERHPLILAHARCLSEACGLIGGPQVRNVATLGGNVAHALPAADGTTALMVLEAEAEIAGPEGRRWQPLPTLFAGPGRSTLDLGREIIVRFRFPTAGPGVGSAFTRLMRPQGVALPILNCAVYVRLEGGRFADVRLCLGPVAPTPRRATEAEEALRGEPVSEESVARAVAVAQQTLRPRTSPHRATAAYRREMIAVLLRRGLRQAISRAKTPG